MLLPVAKEQEHAIAFAAPDMDSLIELASRHRENGFQNILLQMETHSLSEQLQTNTIARRSAIKDNFKPLGYPFVHFIDTGNLMDDTAPQSRTSPNTEASVS